MNVAEIKEPGWYWYHTEYGWVVVQALPNYSNKAIIEFWFVGRDDDFQASEMTGEFIGPLEAPNKA